MQLQRMLITSLVGAGKIVSGGRGRTVNMSSVRVLLETEGARARLDKHPQFSPYFERESDGLPNFYVDRVRRDLGTRWGCLPAGVLNHNAHSCLKAARNATHLVNAPLQPLVPL